MTATEIANIINVLPPGTRADVRRYADGTLTLKIRGGLTLSSTPVSAPPDADAQRSARDWSHANALEEANAIAEERGADATLKLREWATALPRISARELERAQAHGLLRVFEKEDGRDNGARMITAADMLAYLDAREKAACSPGKAGAKWRKVLMVR